MLHGYWDTSLKDGMFIFNLANSGKIIKNFAKGRDDLSHFTGRLIWLHNVNGLRKGTLVIQW